MPRKLSFDTEANGLLPDLTKLHCLALTDLNTREKFDFTDQLGFRPITEGLDMLSKADLLVGHEGATHLHEMRVGGPREVVHVRLLEDVGGRPVLVPAPLGPLAGGSDHEVLGNGDLDAVVAEIGVVSRLIFNIMRFLRVGIFWG